jgi:hypothetical protein
VRYVIAFLAAFALFGVSARADSGNEVLVQGSASWGPSFGVLPPNTTETFNVSFDFNTVSGAISNMDIGSSGPMGTFSFVSNFGGITSPILDFSDSLGDGIQIGNFAFGNPNLPFPEIGSQLQIVLDFCEICSPPGLFVGQGGIVQVSEVPEPSIFLMLAFALPAVCFIGPRFRRYARNSE